MNNNRIEKTFTTGCYVLFDLLLSNGDNFNRFAEAYYDGNELSTRLINIIEMPDNEVKELNHYYKGKTKELSKSVLSMRERYHFATIK